MMYEWFTNRKRVSLVASVVVLLAVMAVSCAPAATPVVVEKEVVVEKPVVQTVVVEKVVEKVITPTPEAERVLVIAVPGLPETIDPHLRSGGGTNNEIAHNLYAFLIDRKVYEEEGQLYASGSEAMPQWAEYEWNEDGSVWTFHVQPGLVFANGDPVDKAAWEWNIDRWVETGGVTWVMLNIAGVTSRDQIKVLDDTTIEMHIDPPNSLNEVVFSSNSSGVVNPKEVRPHCTDDDPWAKDWLRANAAGGGPFVLEKSTADEVVLAKNDNYFEAPEKPWFDKVIYKLVPDTSTRVALLQAGEIDIAYDLPLEMMPELEQDPNLTVYNIPSTQIAFLGMNVHMPPFDNVKVRRAINYAIPYDTIIEKVLLGYGRRMYNYVPDGMPGFDPTVLHYDTDYDKARELLAEAGYPDGFSTELSIREGVAWEEEAAVWVQNGLREVGIDLTIRKMTGAAALEGQRLRNLPFFLKGDWTSTSNDPLNHLNWLVRAECCNYADYDNQRVWDIIVDYVLTTDLEARNAAIREAQVILYEDAPWAPLYQPNWMTVTRKDIKGLVADVFFQNRLWYLYRAEE